MLEQCCKNLKQYGAGDVIRHNSQQRFSAQHSVATIVGWHLRNLSVQNPPDCLSENFNLKNFPGGACARNSLKKSASFAVLLSAMAPILPLYTVSLAPLYQKILRPPLNIVSTLLQIIIILFQHRCRKNVSSCVTSRLNQTSSPELYWLNSSWPDR